MPPRVNPRINLADFAQRATATGLAGLSIWGLWLTAAVWKSRRDDRNIEGVLGYSPESSLKRDEEVRQLQSRINPPPANPS